MKKEIKEWIRVIVVSALIAILITTFVKPTLVKGYSMYPTINQYDYLVISKIPYFGNEPSYGDIVVFKTRIEKENKDKDLIKRVIGLPGDTISVKDGAVYRNGEMLEEPYVYGGFTSGDLEEVVIGEDKMFVMGDNRANSMDSRDESLGAIPMEEIEGKALIRVFPFTKMGKIE